MCICAGCCLLVYIWRCMPKICMRPHVPGCIYVSSNQSSYVDGKVEPLGICSRCLLCRSKGLVSGYHIFTHWNISLALPCLISFWRALLSQLGTSVFRTLEPMKFTVNMKSFRLFSYHHHPLSSESFRLLSLCPSLYLLLRECTQKPLVSSQHLGRFRRLQPAS